MELCNNFGGTVEKYEGKFQGNIKAGHANKRLKVGLSPSKKIFLVCFNESPLKMMKNALYFMLKALFALKLFTNLYWLFGSCRKTAWQES